jgi:hypothetical protein
MHDSQKCSNTVRFLIVPRQSFLAIHYMRRRVSVDLVMLVELSPVCHEQYTKYIVSTTLLIICTHAKRYASATSKL